jgi:hypothetical protein
MKWNAFSFVEEAIGKTKSRMLPFNLKEWFRLGFIAKMASKAGSGGSGGNGGGSGSFSGNFNSDKNQTMSNITGKVIGGQGYAGVIGVLVGIGIVFSMILSFIQSVFRFIFLDFAINPQENIKKKGFWLKYIILSVLVLVVEISLIAPYILNFIDKVNPIIALGMPYVVFSIIAFFAVILIAIWLYMKVFEVKKHFNKNSYNGGSLFLFKLVFTIISLIVLAVVVGPLIMNWISLGSFPIWGWAYLIVGIFLLIIYFFIIWFLLLFLYDFVVPYSFIKKVKIYFSWKQIWKEVRKNKLEVFIYWLARLVVGIVTGLILILIMFVVGLIFLIIGGIFALIGFLLFKVGASLVVLIVLGSLIGLALLLIFGIIVYVVIAPLVMFTEYFSLLNFEKLTKLKILRI